MQAVILAGGIGRRVFPLCRGRPKAMYRLLGKPLLHYVISSMKGVDEAVVVIGKNGERIREYFGNGEKYNVHLEYVQQKEPLGMANALLCAEKLLKEEFLLVNADDVVEQDAFANIIEHHKKSDADLILCYKEVEETEKFGILDLEDGRVKRIVEKPEKGKEPSNKAVISPYLLPRSILEYIRKVPLSDAQFEDSIQKFIEENLVEAVEYRGFFASFKYPWDLLTINKYLMKKHVKGQTIKSSSVSERAIITGNVVIEEGVKVLETAKLSGPCYIGRNSLIGDDALIRDFSSIDEHCEIGKNCEVKNSIIGRNCRIHGSYIGDSIIEENCDFGFGSVTANFRFDEAAIRVKIGNKKIDSGLRKLGVIMGSHSKVGINANIMPGVKVGPRAVVGPGVTLYEDLGEGERIYVDKKSFVRKTGPPDEPF